MFQILLSVTFIIGKFTSRIFIKESVPCQTLYESSEIPFRKGSKESAGVSHSTSSWICKTRSSRLVLTGFLNRLIPEVEPVLQNDHHLVSFLFWFGKLQASISCTYSLQVQRLSLCKKKLIYLHLIKADLTDNHFILNKLQNLNFPSFGIFH